jgi:hypothetical protein
MDSDSEKASAVPHQVDPLAAGEFLSQAWMAYLSGGLRYWSAVAEAWANTLPLLARAVADARNSGTGDATARALRMDELRAQLRELVEYPAREGNRFLAELDEIAAAARAPEPGSGPAGQRHSKIKSCRALAEVSSPLKPDPGADDLKVLAAAFAAQLPEAERHLDAIAADAREEARSAPNPDPLIGLIDHTRRLAHR